MFVYMYVCPLWHIGVHVFVHTSINLNWKLPKRFRDWRASIKKYLKFNTYRPWRDWLDLAIRSRRTECVLWHIYLDTYIYYKHTYSYEHMYRHTRTGIQMHIHVQTLTLNYTYTWTHALIHICMLIEILWKYYLWTNTQLIRFVTVKLCICAIN